MSCSCFFLSYFFFFKQKTAYEMRISDWSSDVCSSDLVARGLDLGVGLGRSEGELLHVLDVVDPVIAGHDHAQRSAMGEGNRRAVHLPGEDGVRPGGQGNGARKRVV